MSQEIGLAPTCPPVHRDQTLLHCIAVVSENGFGWRFAIKDLNSPRERVSTCFGAEMSFLNFVCSDVKI